MHPGAFRANRPDERWCIGSPEVYAVVTNVLSTTEHLAMAENSVKDRVIAAARELPENATFEEAMERLYFLAKIDAGERQADEGKTLSHEEAREHIFG